MQTMTSFLLYIQIANLKIIYNCCADVMNASFTAANKVIKILWCLMSKRQVHMPHIQEIDLKS